MKKIILSLFISVLTIGFVKSQNWQLLIPSTSFNGNYLNLSATAFDRSNNKIFSLRKDQTADMLYAFDLNNNSVSQINNQNSPADLLAFTYDPINSKLIAGRAGTDMVYSIPATGGAWTSQGAGSFDSQHYGPQYYYNQTNGSVGFFGGYGGYAVRNEIWENNGTQWTQVIADNSNCDIVTPPKRNQFNASLGAPNSSDVFFSSGLGSCTGNQFEQSCALGSGWATDVGVWCWLKDLWSYNYQSNEFTQILPPNHSSIVQEGDLTYDYVNNTFYIIGGYVPSPVINPSYNPNFNTDVFRYRVGLDNGFVPLNINGTAPATLPVANMGAHAAYFDATQNRIIWVRFDGVYSIELSGVGISEDVTNSFSVAPNPSSTDFNVYCAADKIGTKYSVVDATGKCLITSTISSISTNIDMSNFAKGIYNIIFDGNYKEIIKINKL